MIVLQFSVFVRWSWFWDPRIYMVTLYRLIELREIVQKLRAQNLWGLKGFIKFCYNKDVSILGPDRSWGMGQRVLKILKLSVICDQRFTSGKEVLQISNHRIYTYMKNSFCPLWVDRASKHPCVKDLGDYLWRHYFIFMCLKVCSCRSRRADSSPIKQWPKAWVTF